MPLYEYACDACGHRFEQIRKFSDPPLDVCPKCGGAVRKLVSSPAFQFKGSGWYVSDYGGKSKESDKSREAKESGESKPSDAPKDSKDSGAAKDAKTESKPSTETTSKSDTSSTSSDTKT
jgi:putative FmdB family regulatory protein